VSVHLANILGKDVKPVGVLALGLVNLVVFNLKLGELDSQTLVCSETKSESKAEGEKKNLHVTTGVIN